MPENSRIVEVVKGQVSKFSGIISKVILFLTVLIKPL
jgi:hypothetical protein